ncbi:MAG: cellulase family glycosylhydrolase [Cyclobacteriaceae bacterium]|nr:cellulase family glycosylhydrolase [Cyclobacteriaceae bacterium]
MVPGFVLSMFLLSCGSNTETNTLSIQGKIRTKGTVFVDEKGNQIIFNGINLVNKKSSENYLPRLSPEMIQFLKNRGINLIRLGIFWNAIEPQPFTYNDEYIQKVRELVIELGKEGIYVFLDMHQDLYGAPFGEGAPEWASMGRDEQHTTGEIWSDAYIMSKAVQKSFDAFWDNEKGESGIGLQDHYALAWAKVASAFQDVETLVGYDIMNEPFIGSGALNIYAGLLDSFASLYNSAHNDAISMEDAMQIWSSIEGRFKALELLNEAVIYQKLLEPVEAWHQNFEKNVLQGFYQKVADSIAVKTPDKLFFLGHGYFCNTGIPTAIEALKGHASVYTPHAYDLVTDTRHAESAGFERLDFIYQQIKNQGERMNIPVLVGEWGAFYGGQNEALVKVATHSIRLMDKYGFSQTYWDYFEGLDEQPYFRKALWRPVPVVFPGRLETYGLTNDHEYYLSGYVESDNKPLISIYIPGKYTVGKVTSKDGQLQDFDFLRDKVKNESHLIISASNNSGKQEWLVELKVGLSNNE